MSRHDPWICVREILDHSREVIELIRGRTRADLDTDRLFNLAMVRLMEIIGEATARISDDFRARYREIPWQNMVAFRNRLIHGYDRINFDILWNILTKDVPLLASRLEQILNLFQRGPEEEVASVEDCPGMKDSQESSDGDLP